MRGALHCPQKGEGKAQKAKNRTKGRRRVGVVMLPRRSAPEGGDGGTSPTRSLSS